MKKRLLRYIKSSHSSLQGLSLMILPVMGLLQLGCKKFVEVEPPNTQLVTASTFNNNATATSALVNIYRQMYNNLESYSMEVCTGLLGDEFTDYSGSVAAVGYYTNAMTADEVSYGPWNNPYNYIYQANAIIEGLQNNTAITPAINKQLTGEAEFIRAFWNFCLSNCYGDIPLATGTSYSVNRLLSRTPKPQVFENIIKDLKDAQSLLNENFVDASDTSATTERIRPCKWAATALLARAYLYNGDYANAEKESSSVISRADIFNLPDSLNEVFLANSPEAIWQLGIPLPNLINTWEGYNFILQGAPSNQALSTRLVDAFEAGDQRRTHWIDSITTTDEPIATYYYPYKYKVFNDQNISEYTMMLRLAEQYLIRAEARAHGAGEGLTGAISDLNVIRHRAGLPDYSGTADQNSLLDAIFHERQVELFTEWGHRWFDMIRMGYADSIMGVPGNVCQSKGGTWSSDWKLFPISQSEIIRDPNLTQNKGY